MKRYLKFIYYNFLRFFPFLNIIYKTRNNQAPVTLRILFFQKVLGFNRRAYWPTHFTSTVTNPFNISIGHGTAPGYSPGCYIQGEGKIDIGDYVLIGPNVGIISANHDLYDTLNHGERKLTRIGSYSWLGMGSVVMPGVELGEYTIVAANAVVSKSFVEGYCVLAGNPAKIIKNLDKNKCKFWRSEFEGYGYRKNKVSN